MEEKLALELEYLSRYSIKNIIISTTAKEPIEFSILPRREYGDIGFSSFMINNITILKQVLKYYDGLIDYFYIDIELKQETNLYEVAQETVKKTELISIKPNDITLESLDLLLREKFKDNLINKNILVIGTGNLASKIMIRLAERQANVFVLARSKNKAQKIISAINSFLPWNTNNIKQLEETSSIFYDVIIGAISSEFRNNELIERYINKQTFFVDVGINNFNKDLIQRIVNNGNELLRLDTRIALPYQMMVKDNYISSFFKRVIGIKKLGNITLVAGGIVGKSGDIIVDQIENPTQIIGIADGNGGVRKKQNEQDRNNIYKIHEYISKIN